MRPSLKKIKRKKKGKGRGGRVKDLPKLHNLNSKFDPHVPHDGSRELAPSRCPLTSTHTKQKCDITTIKGKKEEEEEESCLYMDCPPSPPSDSCLSLHT